MYPYVHSANNGLLRLCRTSFLDISWATVVKDNSAIRDLSNNVKKQQKPEGRLALTAVPEISIDEGCLRVKVVEGLGGKLLKDLNQCRNVTQLRDIIAKTKAVRVSLRADPSDDDYPGGGWCGYLAFDQIRRNALRPVNIKDKEECNILIGTTNL